MTYSAKALGAALLGLASFGGAPLSPAQAQCVSGPRPVSRTFIERDVVEPGVYEIDRRPPVYGWIREKVVAPDGSATYVQRRVLLRPYKNIAHFQRPYIAFSREHVKVYPEGPDC